MQHTYKIVKTHATGIQLITACTIVQAVV